MRFIFGDMAPREFLISLREQVMLIVAVIYESALGLGPYLNLMGLGSIFQNFGIHVSAFMKILVGDSPIKLSRLQCDI